MSYDNLTRNFSCFLLGFWQYGGKLGYPKAAKGINEGIIEPPLGLTYLAAVAPSRAATVLI